MIKNQYFSTKKEMQDYVLYIAKRIFYYIGSQVHRGHSFDHVIGNFYLKKYIRKSKEHVELELDLDDIREYHNCSISPGQSSRLYLFNNSRFEFQYINNLVQYWGINKPKKQVWDYDFQIDKQQYSESLFSLDYKTFVNCKVKKIIYDIIYTELTSFITLKPYFK
jgi:hypothetical protein